MDQLPAETLQEVFLLLDPVSAIEFGVSSIRLQSFLSEPLNFRRFIGNIKLEVWSWKGEVQEVEEGEVEFADEENECDTFKKKQEKIAEMELKMKRNGKLVKKIVSFVSTTSDPGPLLIILFNMWTVKKSLEGMAAGDIFKVRCLVDKYQISELVVEAKYCLHAFKITIENLFKTAATADKMMHTLFVEEGLQLQAACVKFLRSRISGPDSGLLVGEFLHANAARLEMATRLLVLMKDLPCFNCGFNPCRHEVVLTPGLWRSGLGIRENFRPYPRGKHIVSRKKDQGEYKYLHIFF